MDLQEDNVNIIMAMGYTRHQAQVALKQQNGLESAIEWLLEKGVNEKDYAFEDDNSIYRDFIQPDAVIEQPKKDIKSSRFDQLLASNDELKSSGEREGSLPCLSWLFSHLVEAQKFRKELSAVSDDIRSHQILTQSLKQRSQPYLQHYKEMRERISMFHFDWKFGVNRQM
jgi:hypothetical protein